MIDVLLGTFLGDTGAYLGGRAFGTPPARAADLARTRRSRGWSSASSVATLAVWCAGLYQDWTVGGSTALLLGLAVGDRRADRRPVRVARSSATRARRTPATLFGAHGGALDRLDAALFSLVAGYYIWLATSVS